MTQHCYGWFHNNVTRSDNVIVSFTKVHLLTRERVLLMLWSQIIYGHSTASISPNIVGFYYHYIMTPVTKMAPL